MKPLTPSQHEEYCSRIITLHVGRQILCLPQLPPEEMARVVLTDMGLWEDEVDLPVVVEAEDA